MKGQLGQVGPALAHPAERPCSRARAGSGHGGSRGTPWGRTEAEAGPGVSSGSLFALEAIGMNIGHEAREAPVLTAQGTLGKEAAACLQNGASRVCASGLSGSSEVMVWGSSGML